MAVMPIGLADLGFGLRIAAKGYRWFAEVKDMADNVGLYMAHARESLNYADG